MVGDEFEAAQNQPQRSFDAWPEITAATRPLNMLDAQIPPLRGYYGAPHEVVLPPYPPSNFRRKTGSHRRRWQFAHYPMLGGIAFLAGVSLAATAAGFSLPASVSRTARFALSLHLSALLGAIIATTMAGVVAGCALYRVRTRDRRLVPDVPWGSFEAGPPERERGILPCSRSGLPGGGW